MFISEVQIRVRYAETDQMGFVYYGNYATYFEVARVEALRALGFSYKQLEETGILLPVMNFCIDYIKPAHYDDLLTIKTMIPIIPTARIRFEYETYNDKDVLINKANTTLVFIKKETNRPSPAPEAFLSVISKYF
jgi:acyl-CoA thioester hydrolase